MKDPDFEIKICEKTGQWCIYEDLGGILYVRPPLLLPGSKYWNPKNERGYKMGEEAQNEQGR